MKREELNLQNTPKKYRPYPFWSWNSKLNLSETSFQIENMDNAGMGGFFMHARGGLSTPYMEDEWFENVKKSIDEGKLRGLEPWAYDENGWPSGFGSGKVNGKGEKYHQKYLHMEYVDKEENTPRTLINKKLPDGKIMHFFYKTNPYYVDCMDSEVTKDFINEIHEVYKERLGEKFKDLKGIFTDEPQLSRREKSIPYSLIIPYEYKKEYGEDFFDKIEDLFEDFPTSSETRFKFFRLVTRLFSENFLGVIYDWCDKNDVPLTGHMVIEETLQGQLDSNGSCMTNYMYFHIPGVDKLGRRVDNDLLSSQVTSVAAQMGREQVLSESFALCGWDVTFEDLKWIIEWQMVRGVNLLCQHLSPYSLKGIRKRDYPSGHMYQNPWWDEYKIFNDIQSKIGYLLAKGDIKCEVLLLHPQSTAWIKRCDNINWKEKIDKENTQPLYDLLKNLDENQILFHLGDESIMEKIANVNGNILNVGKMAYKYVIMPRCETIFENTYKLLNEFSSCGGKIICVGKKPTMIDGKKDDRLNTLNIIFTDNEENTADLLGDDVKYIDLKQTDGKKAYITYAKRDFDDFTMYYFVNSFEGKKELTLKLDEKNLVEFDYFKSEEIPLDFKEENGKISVNFTIEKKGSKVFFAYKDKDIKPVKAIKENLVCLNEDLKGEWTIEKREPNAFVLDYCDLYVDGVLTHKNIPVVDVEELVNSYKKEIKLRLDFFVNSDIDLDDETFLVLEEEEYSQIYINGKEVKKEVKGYFRDKAFTKLDITSLIKKGENVITLETDFAQSQETYDIIDQCCEFEAIRNKLTYEREVDAMYILGNFSVEFDKEFTQGENDALVNTGALKITKAKDKVTDGEIVTKGYPFFTGKITLSKEIEINDEAKLNSYIEFEKLGSVVTNVCVNSTEKEKVIMAPYKVNLKDKLKMGKNKIEIELISNFRNLLGPLHLGKEDIHVSPRSFMHYSPVYAKGLNENWQDSYAFIKTGIFFK